MGLAANEESKSLKLAHWIIDRACAGIPPLLPALGLASQYLSDKDFPSNDERVDALVRWETGKNFGSGFLIGLGGLLTLPVAVPSALGAAWFVQARMSAAVACIYGHDLGNDGIRTLVLLSVLGRSAAGVLRNVGIKMANKFTGRLIQHVHGSVLLEINKKVGSRLLVKAGERGLVHLARFVPVAGGLVGGTLDALACRAVGRVAKEVFRG